MKLYIFRCRTRPKMFGATRFETASNLPANQDWEFYERVELRPRDTVRFAIDSATLRRQIQQYGWYVWDETPRESRRPAPESKPAPAEKQAPLTPPKAVVPDIEPPPVIYEPIDEEPEPVLPRSVRKRPARHQVVWFDIPVRDLDRAVRFYSAVLGTQLKKEQAGPGVAMASLPHAEDSIGGCLVQNMDARPSDGGPLLYLNTDGRLDDALDAVEEHGGTVLWNRHSITPFGFRAIVLDCEGNRIALHSM